MHIITIEDLDFPDLLEVFDKSSPVGNFIKDGKVQFVRANEKLVMISCGPNPEKISICPVRCKNEAEKVAHQLLEVQKESGNIVSYN